MMIDGHKWVVMVISGYVLYIFYRHLNISNMLH